MSLLLVLLALLAGVPGVGSSESAEGWAEYVPTETEPFNGRVHARRRRVRHISARRGADRGQDRLRHRGQEDRDGRPAPKTGVLWTRCTSGRSRTAPCARNAAVSTQRRRRRAPGSDSTRGDRRGRRLGPGGRVSARTGVESTSPSSRRASVGERAWRLPVGDSFFEAGCEALDNEHDSLLGLAHEAGVEVMEASPWAGDSAPDLEGGELDLFREFDAEIHRLAERVDPAHPGDFEDAARRADPGGLAARARCLGTRPPDGRDDDRDRLLERSDDEMSLLAYAAKLAAGATPTGLRLHLDGGPSRLAKILPSASTFEPGRRWPRSRRTGAA